MFRGGPTHPGIYPTKGLEKLRGVKWRFETEGTVRSSPAVAGETVYIGSGDGRLYALDRETGREHWRYEAGSPVSSSPAVAGGLVFFGSRDNAFHAVDATSGKRRWRVATGPDAPYAWGWEDYDYYTSSPAVVDGKVVAGSGDGSVYAFEAATGAERWRFRTGGRVRSSPAVADGAVFAGSADGTLYAVDLATGTLRWSFDTDGKSLNAADFGYDRRTIQSSPSISDGSVYFGSRDGNLYALDLTGKLRWKLPFQDSWVVSSPVALDGVVFSSRSDAHTVHASRAVDGSEVWRADTGNSVYASLAVAGGTVYGGNHDGDVFALERSTGERRWRFRLPGAVMSSPVIADGALYVGCDGGFVYALEGTDGPMPVRAVFWDETFFDAEQREIRRPLLRYFQRWGYEVVDGAGLQKLLEARAQDRAPSVVVFALPGLPTAVAAEPSPSTLFRRYLDAGGKVVWLESAPFFSVNPATGEFTGLDRDAPGKLLGVDYKLADFDLYGVTVTSEGRRWGLTDRWVGGLGIDPHEVTTVLATDENGRAAAWVRNYGGPPGTGFVQLRPTLNPHDLDQIRAAAEYGITRRVESEGPGIEGSRSSLDRSHLSWVQ